MNIEIDDHELVQKTIVNSINISIVSLNFNESATFRVKYNLNSITNSVPIYIKVEGDDYLGWNNNDNYIIDFILQKLNLTRRGTITNSNGSTTVTIQSDGATQITPNI